ncbi:MAG: VCBS repeat-containing protein [Candidatus Hydrogenedentes bacterium]|nr:VCBS repeat-containing protein [Candidatus Hydrogenedentota bacterium]
MNSIASRARQWAVGISALAFAATAAYGADTFRKPARTYPVGPHPCAIVAQDLNGDGKPEIVTADRGTLVNPRQEKPANDELSLLVAGEDLTYTRQTLRSGFAPYCIVVANIDGRKAPDLVVGSFHAARNRNITVFRNLIDNLVPVYFSVPDNRVGYERMADEDGRPIFTKPGITSLAVGHVDHDGYRDVVATGWASDVLVYLPGHAEDLLGPPRFIPAAGGPRDVELADLDGDGELDLAVTLYSVNEVGIWKGDGTGSFAEVDRFSSRDSLPHKIEVSDINRDGKPDLAVSHCYAGDSIVLFFGEGGLRFSVSQEILLADADDGRAAARQVLEHEIRDVLVEDLNGDGKPDIAAACAASGKVIVLFNESSDGALPLAFRRETYSFDGAAPQALCTADFDGNEKPDLAVALWGTGGDAVALLLAR